LCCNLILLFNEVLTTHFQPKTGINLLKSDGWKRSNYAAALN
jgi:hypothetical protein